MSKPLEISAPADGSVDWNGAREFVMGAEPEPSADAETPEAPEVREFKYRGKTVKVDATTYEVLEDLKRDARGANGRLGSELARTRERLAKLEGMISRPATTEGTDELGVKPPDPHLATRDIVAWQAQMEQYHLAREAKLQADLEAKYLGHVREVADRVQATQAEKDWADRFYSSYDHLDHPDIKPIVAQVYAENKPEIDSLSHDAEAAYERLAELADQRIVRLRSIGKTTTDTGRPPRIESAAGATPRTTVEDKPREVSAASWVARQRLKMSGQEPKER